MGKFLCPRCQRLYQEPDERIGDVIVCNGCQAKVRIPARSTQPKESRYQVNASVQEEGYSLRKSNYRNGDFDKEPSAQDKHVSSSPPPVKSISRWGRVICSLILVAVVIALGWYGLTDPTFQSIERLDWVKLAAQIPWVASRLPHRETGTEIGELELDEFFAWAPPDGWVRSKTDVRSSPQGGKTTLFHAASAEWPSADVRFEFQRIPTTETESTERFKSTFDLDRSNSRITWLPDQRRGPHTVYSVQISNQDDRRAARLYHWYVPERSIECTIAVSATTAELEQAVAVMEPSFTTTVAATSDSNKNSGHQN